MSAILQSDRMHNICRFSLYFNALNFMQYNINIIHSLMDNVPLGI